MSIIVDEKNKIFHLETQNTTYQMGVGAYDILQHLYYGKRIEHENMSYLIKTMDRGFSGNPYDETEKRKLSVDLIPLEYSGAGIGDYRSIAIMTTASNGSRSIDLRYEGYEIIDGKPKLTELPYVRENNSNVQTLKITLTDDLIKIKVDLYYSVFEDEDIITRSAKIKNQGQDTVDINKAASACMDLMYGRYDLIHFHGRHCMERQEERAKLDHSVTVVESRRGMSSHQNNPFVILCDHTAGENQGNCYGFMLMYSGNHRIEAEVDQTGSTRIVMGIHPEGFCWKLGEDESFQTPEVILTHTDKGLNALSRNYHNIIRNNVCPRQFRDVKRPILVNNWEATYFDFNTEKILRLAKTAKELGIEMLVLDDGWFGNRCDDSRGLGDWFVNEEKISGGINYLSEKIHDLDMKFGLWFEPEMISENSRLFEMHPDWAMCDPGRKPVLSRNQLVLDMSREDVQKYLFDSMSKIIEDSELDYIKWDFNRSLANVYSGNHSFDRQGEIAHRFMLGTYALLKKITERYPNVMIEGCAGGGGRFDAGMLFFSPQIWCSDDTDAIARLKIQKGTSYGYPVSTMGSHVSAVPNHQTGRITPMEVRGIVAMSGTFGYELDLEKLSEEEKDMIKKQIQDFHKYYWLIQKGEYYRLTDELSESYYSAWEFLSEDKSEALLNIVVSDVHANPEIPFVKLCGLDENAKYKIEGTEKIISGSALMYGGYVTDKVFGEYPCEQVHFIKQGSK